MVETMDPTVRFKSASVCAVCKHALVRKVGGYRLCCEDPKCIDIFLPIMNSNFCVEEVMNRL